MVRLTDMLEDDRNHLLAKPCPKFEGEPWIEGPPLAERRIAIVTTAGLQLRDDAPFNFRSAEARSAACALSSALTGMTAARSDALH